MAKTATEATETEWRALYALKVRLRRSANLPALDEAREDLLEAMGLAGPDDMDVL